MNTVKMLRELADKIEKGQVFFKQRGVVDVDMLGVNKPEQGLFEYKLIVTLEPIHYVATYIVDPVKAGVEK